MAIPSAPVPQSVPRTGGAEELDATAEELESFRRRLDFVVSKLNELEQRVDEAERFYENQKLSTGDRKDLVQNNRKNTAKNVGCNQKTSPGAKSQDPPCSKRMQELIRQFGTMLRQISKHKDAWPFMKPVDVERFGLHDYFEIIKKPMDFGTIRSRMKTNDGSGYKNVREIYADARLVFTNAMTYNDEKNPFHKMAKTLLEKFQGMWLKLLPKVLEEERRQMEEEKGAQEQENRQIAQETTIWEMASHSNIELIELELQLEELREMVARKSREMPKEEDLRNICTILQSFPEISVKALEIAAQEDPSLQDEEMVVLDLDAQSETTIRKLKFLLREELKHRQLKDFTDKVEKDSQLKKPDKVRKDANAKCREKITGAHVKTAKKRKLTVTNQA